MIFPPFWGKVVVMKRKIAKIFIGCLIFIGLGMQLVRLLQEPFKAVFQSETGQRMPVSAHYSERTEPIQYIVVHSFSLDVADMIERLDSLEVSTHYLIDKQGRVTQLVPENQVAWHAGSSFWRGRKGLNAVSVGIELQNDTLGQTPFPAEQMMAFKKLAQEIMARYQIDPRHIVSHSDIAPTRKVDVGKAFPWAAMAATGIGIWPGADAEEAPSADLRTMLATIGYDTTDVNKALLAFERRFMPEVVATDDDIGHLEENLAGVVAVDNADVRRRLAQVVEAFR